jgi:cellobiose phosphorylase
MHFGAEDHSMTSAAAIDRPHGDQPDFLLRTGRYGGFSPDGREFWITDPATPRPWVNVISNPRLGLVVSHTGSGFTWIDNSQLAVLTRWQQELVTDSSGKFLYLRDANSGVVWSLSPAPAWPPYERFRCRHGLGYTTFETLLHGIETSWTVFCHEHTTAELWFVVLSNRGDRPRTLELTAFLEWNCGVAPSPRREFTRIFLETSFDRPRRAILARSHMWEVPSTRYGHWNTDFPYVTAFATTADLNGALGDKAAFLGRFGDPRDPAALGQRDWQGEFGRHGEAIAALRSPVELPAGGTSRLGFVLATGRSEGETLRRLDALASVPTIETALREAREAWPARLAAHRVRTPEPATDAVVNDWVRYQAISARLWGRAGYYQQSGAFGFRDQLQDSQVWLTIEPERCRSQIALHAAHQFADGSVYHWWHPLSGQGHVTRMTDDLLWLAYVAASYLKETGDFAILDDKTPFLDDDEPRPLRDHVQRAFERVFRRTSPRGLPYIGAGDWNDGLSAAGLEERGESIWLAHFLAGLLADWAHIYGRSGEGVRAADFLVRREALVAAINEHGWDGAWYLRATLDDGSAVGSARNRVGRIFLNAQVWAVLADVAPPERAAACMAAVRDHLVTDAGALLLAPAYDRPVERIGYITRYAPGLRENGGVYTHAATWAIAAACKVRDADLAGRLLAAINPASKDPERYWAEPYVLPGNVDGPDSPHHGRAGWTWYTGSAAWLHRVVTEWVLGVRPEWDGLLIDPCLPPGWSAAAMTRPYRGSLYDIGIERGELPSGAKVEVTLNGARHPSNLLPPPDGAGARHTVRVRCR